MTEYRHRLSTAPTQPPGPAQGPERLDWRRLCAAVIPCLNEAATIAGVVAGVRPHVPTVFVVDDGSTDATGVVAREAGAVVLSHAVNQGKGAALQTGWAEARRRGFAWALTLDGDGQHAADDIPCFLARGAEVGAAVIVGNRMPEITRMPWVRQCVNRWMSQRLSRLTGVALPDSQCGFRLVRLEALTALRLEARHFEIESELLVKMLQAGGGVEFVPVQVRPRQSRSRIHPVVDSWRWLRWWWAQHRPAR